MKKLISIALYIILPLITFASTGRSLSSYSELETEVRSRQIKSPNFLGVEVLGRAIGYSLNYDRAINNRTTVGVAFSRYQFKVIGAALDVLVLPIYGNYYFGNSQIDRFFLTGGLAIWYAKAEGRDYYSYDNNSYDNDFYYETSRAEGTAVYPNVGAGYEFRARTGFTARFTTYAEYIRSLMPWFGLTLGSNF